MPEGETFPKGEDPQVYADYAKKKQREMSDYASQRYGKIGPLKHKEYYKDDYYKAMSDNHLRAYNTAMKLAREKGASPPSFAKGGKVKKTGLAKVHKGERVLTKAQAKGMKGGCPYSGKK